MIHIGTVLNDTKDRNKVKILFIVLFSFVKFYVRNIIVIIGLCAVEIDLV